MRPDESRRLGALYESLREPAPLPADPRQLAGWMARVEADAALAGLISRVLNQGTVTPAEVADAQARTGAAGSAAAPDRVAAAYDTLLAHAE